MLVWLLFFAKQKFPTAQLWRSSIGTLLPHEGRPQSLVRCITCDDAGSVWLHYFIHNFLASMCCIWGTLPLATFMTSSISNVLNPNSSCHALIKMYKRNYVWGPQDWTVYIKGFRKGAWRSPNKTPCFMILCQLENNPGKKLDNTNGFGRYGSSFIWFAQERYFQTICPGFSCSPASADSRSLSCPDQWW